jgi:mRNA-degrading endonuclease RelE of RelBE toxin-antitoxin system
LKITRTARFKKAWKELNGNEKKLAVKAIQHLVDNLKYPALGVKKIQGTNSIWEARVSRSVRMTFQILEDVNVLRNIGKHDETLNKP